MIVELTVTAGPHAGRSFRFPDHSTFLVGRSSQAHFSLPEKDPHVSRLHFLVEVNPPLCRLRDMGGVNGTLVNGARVTQADLKDGDTISAGQTTFVVRLCEIDPGSGVATAELPPAPIRDGTTPDPRPICPADDLARRWSAGDHVRVEAYLAAAPNLAVDTDALVELVYAEFVAREAAGERPSAAEYAIRFPTHAAALARQFRVHAALARNTASFAPAAAAGGNPADAPPQIPGYRIEAEFGLGGMGVVYRAVHLTTGEAAAIKTILPTAKVTVTALTKFLREADIVRQLDHPGIVKFRDSGVAAGRVWFAMEFVPGKDAQATADAAGTRPVGRAVGWVVQTLEALAYAHDRGFVHRDVKPQNLLVSASPGRADVVKVADFGLARAYEASPLSGLTLTGSGGGTPPFMPPEQVRDMRSVKPPADQYAAAATLYRLLTGRHVYPPSKTVEELLTRILQTDPVPLTTHRSDLPPGLVAAIHRALNRDAAARFPDCRGFAAALRPFAG